MKIERNWEWATHQPLIHLMLKEYCPEIVVELGVGLNSTPLFIEYNPKELLCIDNNEEWVELMKQECHFNENASILFHDLGDSKVVNGTMLYEVSDKQKMRNFEYYMQLRNQIKEKPYNPKLLFVDNYTCLRTLSINVLSEVFDIIIYHDCQPEGVPWYAYKFNEYIKSNFNFLILTSSSSWTGCFLRKSLVYNVEGLRKSIAPFVAEFCVKNNVSTSMILQEGY